MSLWHPRKVPDDVRKSVTLPTDPVDSIGRRIYDNLDSPVSGAGGIRNFEVVFEGKLAAYASYTPTVSGIFSFANQDHRMRAQYYSASVGEWHFVCVLSYGIGMGGLIGDGANFRIINWSDYSFVCILMRAY